MMMDEDSDFLQVLHQCQSPDTQQRLRALETLGKEYIDQVKADFLLHLLKKFSRYEEQSAVLSMISQLGSRAPIDELTAILLDRADTNEVPRWRVAETLAVLGENAPIDLLIGILQDPTEEAGLRESIAELLGEFGERVPIDVLIAAVADPEPAVCAAGIQALIAQGPRAPLEPILAQVTHPEWYVRKAAIRALSSARERAPIEPIVAALRDPDWQVREAAALSIDILLEWLGSRVPLAPLVTALGDENANVRESSLDALANHPEYAPIEMITTALDDQSSYVRCAALLVLERMGGNRVPQEIFPKLLEMIAMDPYPNARKYATKTLFILKGIPPGKAHDFPGEEFI